MAPLEPKSLYTVGDLYMSAICCTPKEVDALLCFLLLTHSYYLSHRNFNQIQMDIFP